MENNTEQIKCLINYFWYLNDLVLKNGLESDEKISVHINSIIYSSECIACEIEKYNLENSLSKLYAKNDFLVMSKDEEEREINFKEIERVQKKLKELEIINDNV